MSEGEGKHFFLLECQQINIDGMMELENLSLSWIGTGGEGQVCVLWSSVQSLQGTVICQELFLNGHTIICCRWHDSASESQGSVS